ncbi:LysM peptidoglycan-binding domain-containing protein [Haloferula helveola]
MRIPIALAVLGMIFGAAGLYFGLAANQRLAAIGESIEAGSTGLGGLESRMEDYETQRAELGAQVEKLEGVVKEFEGAVKRASDDSERRGGAITELATALQVNRTQIIKNAESISKLARVEVPAVSPAAPSMPDLPTPPESLPDAPTTPDEPEMPDTAGTPDTGGVPETPTSPDTPSIAETPRAGDTPSATTTYVIRAGDTFGKIASRLGIELQAILDANPDADPSRLQIGDVINVPTDD